LAIGTNGYELAGVFLLQGFTVLLIEPLVFLDTMGHPLLIIRHGLSPASKFEG
jgi:hypothetical protein